MIAFLRYNGRTYYCSHCLMIQKKLEETCDFCGASFSNYEQMLLKWYEDNNIPE